VFSGIGNDVAGPGRLVALADKVPEAGLDGDELVEEPPEPLGQLDGRLERAS
jgi:hypothetical protein